MCMYNYWCVPIFSFPLLTDTYCDEDWISYKNYCYYLSEPKETKTYNEASDICVTKDALLTSIEGPEENDFLTERYRCNVYCTCQQIHKHCN